MKQYDSSQADFPTSGQRGRTLQRGMLIGGLVGGVVGALIRGGVTLLHLRWGGEFGLLASLPSAGIGFLCGAIAGCLCRAPLGTLVGAILSAGVFGLFVMPIAYLALKLGIGGEVAQLSWPLLVQKGVAGAIAGGIGGLVGARVAASDEHKGDRVDHLG